MFAQIMFSAAVLVMVPVPKGLAKDNEEAPIVNKTRTELLVEGLRITIELGKPIESPLKEVVEYLEDVASPEGAAKDSSKRVKIFIDEVSFKANSKKKDAPIDETTIKLPKVYGGAKLECALNLMGDQLGGTFIIRDDAYHIVTWEKALGRPLAEGERVTLINFIAKATPLDQAMNEIAERTGKAILFSPLCLEKAKTPITGMFLNLPFETAVELAADMAGLKVVQRPNALYITTADNARELNGKTVPVIKSEPKLIEKK